MSSPAQPTHSLPADLTNVADLLRASAHRLRDAVALVEGTGSSRVEITWSQLDTDVECAAVSLRNRLGLHPGDRVALTLSNTSAFVIAYFAILRAGLVAVPLNTEYPSSELARLLGETDAKVVLCEDATVSAAQEAVAETHRAVVDPAGLDALIGGGRGAAPLTDVSGAEDLAVLLFTSGTSGRPKAVMLSHRALLANLRQCLALRPAVMTADDVVLLVLPLFHIYGLNDGLGMAAATGARAVLAERFETRETLTLIRREGVTSIPGSPPMYAAWAELEQHDGTIRLRDYLGGVRLLVSGAAPLPPALFEHIRRGTGLPIHEGYGLTETSSVVTSTIGSPQVKPGSVGRPVPGVDVRLVDVTGAPVTDDAGEIEVRGDNLFSGYWPDGSGGPRPDGWWGTGDVAYVDDEGDLFLVDRRSELVLVSGFRVYPREIEEVIAEHPDIAEVAVIAVPDPQTGEAVKAYVVARAGAVVRPEDVVAHCAGRLARFKRPTVLSVVDQLPHSATGRVAKGRLREGSLPSEEAP
ncbi:MAG: long-chain acyl-CoA synthetase [Actinomycetota bacterium]|nr:long-chain acyl-CoA synthetase [Actinomycetota bacterium]